MPNETDLLNIALGKIGAQRINAIDDGSTNANYCQTFYPALLDARLRDAHWNFATGRATLARLLDFPTFEFQYAYALPADFIKLREYYDDQVPWLSVDLLDWGYTKWMSKFRIETVDTQPPTEPPTFRKAVVTNATTVKIVYTRRVTNPDIWDGQFFQMMASWLAGDLAEAIMRNGKKAAELHQEAIGYLALAVATDGQEQSVEKIEVNDLISGR